MTRVENGRYRAGEALAGFWLVAAGVVALDQWTKYLVQQSLPVNGTPLPLLPGIYLTHVHNTGAAFGQLRGAGAFLAVAAAVAAVAIVAYHLRLLRRGEPIHPLLALGLSLPLGGAVGNMIDRLRFGHVIDFIDLRWWPVFNVADSAITVGVACLAIYFLLVQRPEEAETRADGRECRSVETAPEGESA